MKLKQDVLFQIEEGILILNEEEKQKLFQFLDEVEERFKHKRCLNLAADYKDVEVLTIHTSIRVYIVFNRQFFNKEEIEEFSLYLNNEDFSFIEVAFTALLKRSFMLFEI